MAEFPCSFTKFTSALWRRRSCTTWETDITVFNNVTIVIIIINMIITTKAKPPCVHGPWQDAEVCRRPYWLCALVPRDRSIDDDVMMDMMMAVIVTLITMMTVIIAMIMMMLVVCTRAPRPIYWLRMLIIIMRIVMMFMRMTIMIIIT